MPEPLWKTRERITARPLKGRRIPSSGRAQRDIETPDYPICVEFKHRETVPKYLVDVLEQAEILLAQEEGSLLIPLARIRARDWGPRQELALMKFKYLKILLDIGNEISKIGFVEVKREYHAIGGWLTHALEQAEIDAEATEAPLAIIHQKGWQYPRDLVVMKFKFFKYLLERLNDKG